MSAADILFCFCVLFLAVIVALVIALVHAADGWALEKSMHRITMIHLENERSKR